MEDLSIEKLQKHCMETMTAADRALSVCRRSVETHPEQVRMALLPVANAIRQLDDRLEEIRICRERLTAFNHENKDCPQQNPNRQFQSVILQQLGLSLFGERETLEKLKSSLEKAADASDEKTRLEEIRNFLKFAEKLEHS